MTIDGEHVPSRPALSTHLTESEFRRWYWLQAELAVFARELGVAAGGPKATLGDRIAARLGKREWLEPQQARFDGGALREPLSDASVISAGQRSSQQLRAYFSERIGTGFRFDGAMRSFIATGGVTLGQAVQHWHDTRGSVGLPIDPQFELNRFTRAWHAGNPGGSREELLAAWANYRSLPIDMRGLA